ncbi:MAG TPA: hypothetical protein VND87_10390 [Stellaceae bacterium]|nr:hypothetical protein [Stellaceae bacterium]
MAVKREAARDERIALRHPDARACSVDGRIFAADRDGVFLVPAEVVLELASHGFVPLPAASQEVAE